MNTVERLLDAAKDIWKSYNEHPFVSGIQGYASDEYAEGNVILLDTLNRLTENYTESQVQHLIDIFVACSRYELAFWEMSWRLSK